MLAGRRSGPSLLELTLLDRDGYRVQGTGYRVEGSGHRAQGTGYRVEGSGHRAQGTGYRAVLPGYCTLVSVSCSLLLRSNAVFRGWGVWTVLYCRP